MLSSYVMYKLVCDPLMLQSLKNRPTAEKANFESLIGLVFHLLPVKVFDKNRKI